MELALYYFIPTAIAAAILANIGIWPPRNGWLKVSAIAVTALFLPLAYGSISELLSRPKPVSMEWARRAMPEARLIGASLQEGEANYIWLPDAGFAGTARLPVALEQGNRKSASTGPARGQKTKNSVKFRRPFDADRDTRKPMFYAEPRRPLPTKRRTQEVPLNYVRPDRAG